MQWPLDSPSLLYVAFGDVRIQPEELFSGSSAHMHYSLCKFNIAIDRESQGLILNSAMTIHAAALIMKTLLPTGYFYEGFLYDTKILTQIASFFLDVVPSLIVVTLVLFDEGIRIVRLNSAAKANRLPHRIAYAWCTVTVLLALVTFSGWIFIIRNTKIVSSIDPDFGIIIDNRAYDVRQALPIVEIVRFSLTVVAVCVIVIRSIYLRIRTRRLPHLRRVSSSATLLWTNLTTSVSRLPTTTS